MVMAIAGIIVVALLVGAYALLDSSPYRLDSAQRYDEPAAVGGASVAETTSTTKPTTIKPSTTTTTTAISATTTTEAPSVTEPPPAEVPAPQPPATEPPVTAAPSPPVAVDPVATWTPVGSAGGGFVAELPAAPRVSEAPLRIAGRTVTRSEYAVDGPGGSLISITTVAVSRGARTVDALLSAVATQAATGVNGSVQFGRSGDLNGGRYVDFTVTQGGGQIRGRAVYAGGTLFTITMFKPGDGSMGTAADATFDRVVASFHPRRVS